MIVGIDMGTLITLVAFPPTFILIMFVAVYFLWVPKPAKACISAKIGKKGIDVNTTNIGGITFRPFKMRGPGIIEIKKRFEMNIYPRSPEAWAAKVFNCDGLPMVFSCSDKAVAANPEMLKILEFNQYIAAQKSLKENEDKSEKEIFDEFLKNNPDAYNLLKTLRTNYANVPKKEKGKKITFMREVAVLLDPRRLKDYISWNLTPAQLLAVDQTAFNDGFEEGQKPLLQRILPLILVMCIGIAIIVLCGAMAGLFG